MWYPDPDTLHTPLHASLAAAIEQAILTEELPAGARLPPHRGMADRLGLSVHTVSKAYQSLRKQNLIDGQIGRGSYVCGPAPQDAPQDPGPEEGFDFSTCHPVHSPQHCRRFQQSLQELAAELDPSALQVCKSIAGTDADKSAGARWLAACGFAAAPDQVILTNGGSHGFTVALSALTRPGDTVLSDSITDNLLVSGCAYLGLKHLGLEADPHGILPDALTEACRTSCPKVLCLLPSLANPVPVMMPEDRRKALARIAQENDLYIIEHDPLGPVAGDRPPPVSALLPERSLYMTALSTCLMPGLHAGYMAGPSHLLPSLKGRLLSFGGTAMPLMRALASRWVLDGTALELAGWQQNALKGRHRIACRVLHGVPWTGHPSAMHLWLPLPEGWSAAGFSQYARQMQIAVMPDMPFLAPGICSADGLRISLGAVQGEGRFRKGLEHIAALLKLQPHSLPHLAF
ncbi:PLP-dependent aminotransferase family protein [Leisingera methylohalidivorans]|uniref:GntR family transcriptional regulator n=1 Tax=Leisingera methylohalidivorans DSM 14336 TaxID=999552 RepID=V9VVR2_9RHOB|nr:PLP-dependent aminotransferase family protein [Leisingera methylohalidivorans]AHD02058.1 GntR family transcriptional regulator [Leisingera methylohalidivorans DSM 14336]